MTQELSKAFFVHCRQRDRVQSALESPTQQINECTKAEELIEIAARYRQAYFQQQRIAEWMTNPAIDSTRLDEFIECDRALVAAFKDDLQGHSVRVLRESAIAEIRTCLLSEIENEGVLW